MTTAQIINEISIHPNMALEMTFIEDDMEYWDKNKEPLVRLLDKLKHGR